MKANVLVAASPLGPGVDVGDASVQSCCTSCSRDGVDVTASD